MKQFLIFGWSAYFISAALLLIFPRHLVSHWSLWSLLILSLVLIPTSVLFLLAVVYRKRKSASAQTQQ